MGTETRTSENPIASGNQKVAFPAAEVKDTKHDLRIICISYLGVLFV